MPLLQTKLVVTLDTMNASIVDDDCGKGDNLCAPTSKGPGV